MSKRDVCQKRECCEGQVACLALALCLCHFCMLALLFRQMDLSTALFRTDSNVYTLQVCSHSLQLSSWGLRKVTTLTHYGSSWECDKVSPVQRAPATHHHHHGVSRGVHACLLWLGHVAKQSLANSAELWLSASPGLFQELCFQHWRQKERTARLLARFLWWGKLRVWDWCARTEWDFPDGMPMQRKRWFVLCLHEVS